jgi:hypothetical protein
MQLACLFLRGPRFQQAQKEIAQREFGVPSNIVVLILLTSPDAAVMRRRSCSSTANVLRMESDSGERVH